MSNNSSNNPSSNTSSNNPSGNNPSGNNPSSNKSNNNLFITKSYVSTWHTVLKSICIVTIVFSVCSMVFASLPTYDEEGNVKDVVNDGNIQSLLLPTIAPVLFLMFASRYTFSRLQKNKARGQLGYGERSNTVNGKQVVSDSFDGWKLPLLITSTIYVCYVISSATFFEHGDSRCDSNTLDNSSNLFYFFHKMVCYIFNQNIIRTVVSVIILIQSIMLAYYTYRSMPLDIRTSVNKRKKYILERRSKNVKFAAQKAALASNGMLKTLSNSVSKTAKSLTSTTKPQNNKRTQAAQKIQAIWKGAKAREKMKKRAKVQKV